MTDAARTYSNCLNLRNAYLYSEKISSASYLFSNRNTDTKLNIYCPQNSTTLNRILWEKKGTEYDGIAFWDAYTIVGANITWTNDFSNNCHYNAQYNIYIYPVENVAAVRDINGD